jgi:AcrR family transcriptional regulator
MASAHPYHHGNLRQAVLDHAAVVVRSQGASELSLRELAAAIGVTHAAPRRYFPNRQELLDALAIEGFTRLGTRLREAADGPREARDRLRAIAHTYLEFTTSEANLVDLMFAHKHGANGPAVGESAAAAFAPIVETFQSGRADGTLPDGDPERAGLLLLATLQGLAGLVNCGVVPSGHRRDLIDDVVDQLPGGADVDDP